MAVLLGAAALVSPNRASAATARPAVAAPAHTDRLKVAPADGVTDEADGEGAAVRENPAGDEEEREATVPHAGAVT
ncbi:MAG TPA: hypothetical protein VHV49_18395, partial [Pseudonocardiaceae bacterium]|nr:hypothetical protein [Pseudonocardiaceae bacterium]